MKSKAYLQQQVDAKLAKAGVTYKNHYDTAYVKLKEADTLKKLDMAESFDFKESPMYAKYKVRSEELNQETSKSMSSEEKIYLNNQAKLEQALVKAKDANDMKTVESLESHTGEAYAAFKEKDLDMMKMDHFSDAFVQYKLQSIGGADTTGKKNGKAGKYGKGGKNGKAGKYGRKVNRNGQGDTKGKKVLVFNTTPKDDPVPPGPVPIEDTKGKKVLGKNGRNANRNGRGDTTPKDDPVPPGPVPIEDTKGKKVLGKNGRNANRNGLKNNRDQNKQAGAQKEALELQQMFANIQEETDEFEAKYESLFAGVGSP
jgi:hypothetical protein